MDTAAVYSYVEFVGLYLAELFRGGPEVVLKRIAGNSREDIKEPIVAEFRQEGLLV